MASYLDEETATHIASEQDQAPKQETLTLWKLLRKHGVGLYAAQMICNDAMLHGVTIPADRSPQETVE